VNTHLFDKNYGNTQSVSFLEIEIKSKRSILCNKVVESISEKRQTFYKFKTGKKLIFIESEIVL